MDSGSQLTSAEMYRFAKWYNFKITTRSPAFPQANGMAEAAVKITKRILESDAPSLALLHYTATPTSATGCSLADLLFYRLIHSTLPSAKISQKGPSRQKVREHMEKHQKTMAENSNRSRRAYLLSELCRGDSL